MNQESRHQNLRDEKLIASGVWKRGNDSRARFSPNVNRQQQFLHVTTMCIQYECHMFTKCRIHYECHGFMNCRVVQSNLLFGSVEEAIVFSSLVWPLFMNNRWTLYLPVTRPTPNTGHLLVNFSNTSYARRLVFGMLKLPTYSSYVASLVSTCKCAIPTMRWSRFS